MTKGPIKFEVYSKADCKVSQKWTTFLQGLSPIDVCIPIEFNGPGKAYTPEDLFGSAVLNCLIGVFKGNCEKNNITFSDLEGKIEVSLNCCHTDNVSVIDHLEITINVKNASDKKKAKMLLEKSIKECPISNSVKSGKTYHINVD